MHTLIINYLASRRERGGRFSYREVDPGIPPSPGNLEIVYGYYISYLHVTGHKYVSSNVVWNFCPRLHQKQSKFSWGAHPHTPLVGTYACISHTTIILLPSCSPHLKILYVTLGSLGDLVTCSEQCHVPWTESKRWCIRRTWE